MSLISTAEVKEFLQITHSAQDAVIQILIDGFEEWLKENLGITVHDAATAPVTTEDLQGGGAHLYPTVKPIVSVTSITDITTGNTVDEYSHDQMTIWQNNNSNWVDTRVKSWRVVYRGGYTTSTVPKGLKMLMLDAIFRAYRNRGGKATESAAGYLVNWTLFKNSDLLEKMAPFCLKSPLW